SVHHLSITSTLLVRNGSIWTRQYRMNGVQGRSTRLDPLDRADPANNGTPDPLPAKCHRERAPAYHRKS
ncbi:MAG: hypothetical protein AAF514_03885, partial [Verrucomicrobiota bacterium]